MFITNRKCGNVEISYKGREVEATSNRVPFNFDERYQHMSGVIIEEADGSVREINKYDIFYEDGIDEQSEIAWFVLHALAAGYTLAAPPLVLPNTKPGQHYKMGVTIYFFLEVPPNKFSEEAKKAYNEAAQRRNT